jgi:hypothetical protein
MSPQRLDVTLVLDLTVDRLVVGWRQAHVERNGFVYFALSALHATLVVRVEDEIQTPLLVLEGLVWQGCLIGLV